MSLSPNLTPVANLLGIDVASLRNGLGAWGPGKFDAEVLLDGKGFRPDGGSAATLIPPAFGLAGVNLHTWTGWGSVTHWNAFVANLEMHGKGRFFDPRLNDREQFPIAAANGFADLPHIDPDEDRITKQLPALHFYQLSLPAPKPQPGKDFDPEAAERGDGLFSGKAKCNNCHVEPLWTEPGWNLHTPDEVCLDPFQADRAPDHRYRTRFILQSREKGLPRRGPRWPSLPAHSAHRRSIRVPRRCAHVTIGIRSRRDPRWDAPLRPSPGSSVEQEFASW